MATHPRPQQTRRPGNVQCSRCQPSRQTNHMSGLLVGGVTAPDNSCNSCAMTQALVNPALCECNNSTVCHQHNMPEPTAVHMIPATMQFSKQPYHGDQLQLTTAAALAIASCCVRCNTPTSIFACLQSLPSYAATAQAAKQLSTCSEEA